MSRRLGILVIILLLTAGMLHPGGGWAEGLMRLYFLDVGQADATIIICDDEVLMIDGGNAADSRLIYAYLRNTLGIRHINYMIATHPHEDHVGGLAAALNACTVDVLYTSVLEYDSKAFRSLMKYAREQDTRIVVPSPGDTFSVGTASVVILGPVRNYANSNDMSIVCRITFPVETVNLLDDGTDFVDQEWADFTAEMWAEGHSFFLYRSDSVDSLASCCRLRNELQDNTFSYTLGAGGVATGSKCVMTINVNRLVQNAIWDDPMNDIREAMGVMVGKVHKYLLAFNAILKERREAGLLPVYDAGFVTPEKQYLTVGINGFIEGAESLGIEPDADNPDYIAYAEAVLQPIYEANREARSEGIMWNTEMVPAENLGVKNASWDRAEKLFVPRDCYNSYFFRVEDPKVNVLDKLKLHGRKFTRYLDGGSACHINLDEHLRKEQYALLLRAAIRTGCNYLTFNVPNTLCRSCCYISKHRLDKCPKCGSIDLDYATRVIGYLKLVSRFAEARQEEEGRRHYATGMEDDHEPSD